MNLHAFSIILTSKLLPFILAFIGFGILITVHEVGHFLFCKIFKVSTPTFSIGMGPTIFQKNFGSTNFRLAAIPIGGYVEIAGLSEMGQGEQKSAEDRGENSFASKKYWQKLFILMGGVLFNLIFAYLVFSTLFFVGIQKQKGNLFISTKIDKAVEENFGIKASDQIISINNELLSQEPKKLIPQIEKAFFMPLNKNDITTQIQVELLRGQEKISLTLTPKAQGDLNEKLLNSIELKTEKIPGEYEKYSFFGSIYNGIKATNQWIIRIIAGLKYLITERTLKGAGGPIMIISQSFETAQKGIIPLLIFLAIISINLAIINLLPIGALDGGQILFATIEAIIRREIPEFVRLSINVASWVLILSLILYLSYKDIIRIFTGN
jgi:regulator of sigma E protease